MSEKNPARLPAGHQPAVVTFCDDTELFVAHHDTLASAWLLILGWSGSKRKIPPERIKHVELVETTLVASGHPGERRVKAIDDEELREKAREASGLDNREQRREVVA